MPGIDIRRSDFTFPVITESLSITCYLVVFKQRDMEKKPMQAQGFHCFLW